MGARLIPQFSFSREPGEFHTRPIFPAILDGFVCLLLALIKYLAGAVPDPSGLVKKALNGGPAASSQVFS